MKRSSKREEQRKLKRARKEAAMRNNGQSRYAQKHANGGNASPNGMRVWRETD